MLSPARPASFVLRAALSAPLAALTGCSSTPASSATDASTRAADAGTVVFSMDAKGPGDTGVGDGRSRPTPSGDASASDSGIGDARSGDVFRPATHEPFPQVPDQGGPKLASAAVVTVTFAGDTRRGAFEQYAQWIVGSTWLASVGADYGVGAGTVAGAVQVTESAPATETSGDIETFLATHIQDGTIPRPAGGLGDALYLVYLPSTTTMTATFVDAITAVSCKDWEAYHGEAHALGLDFSYAVMADCGSIPGLTEDETVEFSASHELIEAATDALPITHPAYQLRADPTDPWYGYFRFEVEVGDLCEAAVLVDTESGHVAQRIWSNTAAAEGRDPCVPVDPTIPYFNTSATPDAVQHVAPGASTTLQLRGWSSSATPDWQLSTQVVGTLAATTSLSSKAMNNGGSSSLTVSVPAGAAAGSSARIILWSDSGWDTNPWMLDVVTP